MFSNSIWIASVPRTGSMWTTNIIREIYTVSNFNVLPKHIIQYDKEWVDYYNSNAQLDENELNIYIFKIHSKLTVLPPRSKIITNIRNPYDICASHNEFMKCDLVKSINVAKDLINWKNYYKSLSKDIFEVKFEQIENYTKDLINKLSTFCNLKLSAIQIENIIEKYNKSNVQNIIKKNDEYIKKQKNENKILDNKKIVKFKDGNFRSFDLYTGFQSGHISQRKAGQWRDMFSKEEISTIIKQLDEIATELGYPSEKE